MPCYRYVCVKETTLLHRRSTLGQIGQIGFQSTKPGAAEKFMRRDRKARLANKYLRFTRTHTHTHTGMGCLALRSMDMISVHGNPFCLISFWSLSLVSLWSSSPSISPSQHLCMPHIHGLSLNMYALHTRFFNLVYPCYLCRLFPVYPSGYDCWPLYPSIWLFPVYPCWPLYASFAFCPFCPSYPSFPQPIPCPLRKFRGTPYLQDRGKRPLA